MLLILINIYRYSYKRKAIHKKLNHNDDKHKNKNYKTGATAAI